MQRKFHSGLICLKDCLSPERNSFVFHTSHEGKEQAPESEKKPAFKGEKPFDPEKEWNSQVTAFTKEVLGEKYRETGATAILTYMNTGKDIDAFKENREDIVKMRLDGGRLTFLDDDGNTVASFDISEAIKEMIEDRRKSDFDLVKMRTRRFKRRLIRKTSGGNMMLRLMATEGPEEDDEKTKDDKTREKLEDPEPAPLSDEEREAAARMNSVLKSKKAKRDSILETARGIEEDESDFVVPVSSRIQSLDKDEFLREWRFLNHSHEIDDLLREKPDGSSGYVSNPFERLKWTPDTLREIIQEDDNGRLYFEDVSEAVYNDRYEDFQKELKDSGVPQEVIDLLDKPPGTLSKIPVLSVFDKIGSRDDTLIATYNRLEKISAQLKSVEDIKKCPEELRAIFPHKKKLQEVVQILGDSVVYANRLVNLVAELRYQYANPTSDRERTMREYARGKNGEILNIPENRVKSSLAKIFLKDVESPTEYESELSQIFQSEASRRKITFNDLNGRTATVEGEWFTHAQSRETAYKLAWEAITDQKQNPDGTWSEVVDENVAVAHANDLLLLGISTSSVLPANHSLKSIIEELGPPLRWKGDIHDAVYDLFEALSIKDINDLADTGTEKKQLLESYRTRFIRIGSVVWQKNNFEKQERKKEKAASLVLTKEQADDIIAGLEKAGVKDTEKLQKFRNALVGGAAVVLPDHGGGFAVHYEFENGTLLDVSGIFPEWSTVGAGAAVGQKFEAAKDVSITIHAAAGYSFAEAPTGGWMLGAGASITKKFEKVDGTIHAGGGSLLASGIPTAFLGAGLNWAKSQEKFEASLSKKELEHHIAEVDATTDHYKTVLENPEKYPALARISSSVEHIDGLSPESKKDLFEAAYKMFKEGLAKEALDDTTKRWYERFIPTGAGLGVAMMGPVPVPYVYLEFQLWSRSLVYRVASNIEATQRITEQEARKAILASYSKSNAEVATKEMAVSGNLMLDPKSGKLKLESIKNGKFDFSRLDKFSEFRDELSREAKIFVEPGPHGLLLLKPQEAYGNIEVFLDPALKDDVVAVTRHGRLYLSVKNNAQIFISRQDVTYPFEERGAVETTKIVISGNPHLDSQVIEAESPIFLEQMPGREWIRRPGKNINQKKESNIFTVKAYDAWWGAGRPERLSFQNLETMKTAYDELLSSVSLATEKGNQDLLVRPEKKTKIEALAKDKAFVQEFRKLTTDGYDLIRDKGKISADWEPNFPALSRKLKEKLGEDINAAELQAAVYTLLVASFMNIQKQGPEKAKQEYLKFLEKFERPMLNSIFGKYYENYGAEKDQKAKEAVDYIIKTLENVDVTQPGGNVPEGTLYATLVGKGGITGMRRMWNFHETNPEYGIIGKVPLDVGATGVFGEVADFWLKKLSPYIRGIGEKPLPTIGEKQYEIHQKLLHENLHSPLALKLVPLVAVLFTPEETKMLAGTFRAESNVYINETNGNLAVVKKFLAICDRVRSAELEGKRELDLGQGFTLVMKLDLAMGVYKKCGNITGIASENFALVHKGSKKAYFAGMSEGLLDVDTAYSRTDISAMFGAAIPIIKEQRIATEKEAPAPRKTPRQPPEKPETGPPQAAPEAPAPPPPPEEPLPITSEPVEKPNYPDGPTEGEEAA